MSQRILVFDSLLFAAATLAIIGTCNLDRIFPPGQTTDFYDELSGRDNRIFLKEGELLREVKYQADKITRRQATAIGLDGRVTEFWYWPSGNLKEAITYFAANSSNAPKADKRAVQRHAKFLEDGITYASDFEFNLDGTLAISTILENAGELAVKKRFTAGGAIKQEELFNRSQTVPFVTWNRLSSRSFHANGTLSESIEALGVFGYDINRYSSDGRLTFTSQLSEYATEYRESLFFPNGKSLKRKVFQNTSGTNVKTYAAPGILLEERAWFGTVGKSMMNVKSYDPISGKPTLEQIFMYMGSKYEPYGYTVFDKGAKALYVLLSMDSPYKVKIITSYHSRSGDNGEHTTVVYDKDGFVTREFRSAGALSGGKNIWVHDYKSSDKIQRELPSLNPEWQALKPFQTPTEIVKFSPSRFK